MDEFRYILGVVLIIIMPVVITFWLVIHLGTQYWRKKRPLRAYSVAGAMIAIVTIFALILMDILLGKDLGMSWILFLTGAAVYLASWILWRPVKQHLSFKVFAGMPEITNEAVPLIRDGPFNLVRHPRYLMVSIGIIGWCLMSNYSGVYLLGVASIIGLLVIIKLEERELVTRFGEDYIVYQNEVPALVPRWANIVSFFYKKP